MALEPDGTADQHQPEQRRQQAGQPEGGDRCVLEEKPEGAVAVPNGPEVGRPVTVVDPKGDGDLRELQAQQ